MVYNVHTKKQRKTVKKGRIINRRLQQLGKSTTTLKLYSLFITLNRFRLEHDISLNNCFVFTLKQFATIHHQKQSATESGRVKIHTFVAGSQLFKSLHYVYIHVVYFPRATLLM